MNNVAKILIPLGIGFCLGRTRVLISSLKEKKFQIRMDLSSPVVTNSNVTSTIASIEERVTEIENFFNTKTIIKKMTLR